jgi:hypothetical protein
MAAFKCNPAVRLRITYVGNGQEADRLAQSSLKLE